MHDKILARVDILERLSGDRWRLIEVKSSTDLKDHYLYAGIFVHGFIDYLGPVKPVFWALSVMFTAWLFLWFLHREKIFLKV